MNAAILPRMLFLGIISISRNLNTVYFIVRLHVSKESVGGGVCDGVGGCDGTGGEGV